MDWETIACVETSQRSNQNLSKTHDINLKTSTILAKKLVLVAWLGPERVSADGYITVLKIQTDMKRWKINKDGIILINQCYHLFWYIFEV